MSEADIALIRAGLDDFNAGDFDRMLESFADNAEVERAGGLGVIRGKPEIREWLKPDAIEYQRAESASFRQNGEFVLVTCDWLLRGKGSGVEVASTIYLVFTLRAEVVVRLATFFEEDEALDEAGMLS